MIVLKSISNFCGERGGRVRDTDWMLLIAAFSRDFDSLRDKHHSANARREFIKNLQTRLNCGFDALDQRRIGSQSNLDFAGLSYNYDILRFDRSSLQKHRIRLDKELVGWRNGVAHGGAPDLSALDVFNHVDFTSELLVSIADRFPARDTGETIDYAPKGVIFPLKRVLSS